MQKQTLTSVIDKYHLNGIVESVKWNIKDKNITVDFITPMKNLVGKVTSPNFDLDDTDLGIYNTSQFNKLVKIMDNTVVLGLTKSPYGTPLELTLADNQYDLNYYLSDLMLIESVPAINEPASYDAEANIDSDFISKFANAKKALGDVKQFTIKDELNSENMKDLVIVIGDGNGYANKIKFKTPCESMFGLNEIPFPADVMMELLKANEEADSGTIQISQEGLMKVSFKEESIESVYYLVRLSQQ
jgi:hypothetical protein